MEFDDFFLNSTGIVMYDTTVYISEEDDYSFPLYAQVLLGLTFCIMGVTNIVGNSCTVIAFAKDQHLRTVHNYYIVNLATADLLIGIISVPFYAAYTIDYYTWVFGKEFCKAFLVIDFWACAESSLTIILISYDRFKLVTLGAEYNQIETKKKALVKIGITWVAAFLLYGPAVIGFDLWRGYSVIREGQCDVEFMNNGTFLMVTTFIEFGIPFALIFTFNILVYWSIRKRSLKVSAMKVAVISHATDPAAPSSITTTLSPEAKSEQESSLTPPSPTGKSLEAPRAVKKDKQNSLARHKKAAKCLAIIVVTYAICWTPYEITAVVLSVCEECVSEDLYEGFAWLLWFNSSINPVLYAATSERFMKHFITMLCPWKTV